MTKRAAQIFFVFLLAVGILTAGVLIWAQTDLGSSFISNKVRESLKEKTGLVLKFSKIEVLIFPPGVLLRDLTVRDSNNLVSCFVEESEIALSAVDIISWKFNVEEIYFGAPKCDINLDKAAMDALQFEDDKTDLPDKGLDLSTLPKFDVFAISNGEFNLNINDPERLGELSANITGFNMDVSGKTESIEIRGLVEKIKGSLKKNDNLISEQLENLETIISLSSGAVDVRLLSGIVAGATIKGTDVHLPLPLGTNSITTAMVKADVPLELFKRLPVELPGMWGTAGFNGQVNIDFDEHKKPDLSARGEVFLRSAKIDDFIIGDLDGVFYAGKEGVSFSQVKIKTAQGNIVLNGNVDLVEPFNVDAKAQLTNIELAQLLENLTLDNAYVMQKIGGSIEIKGNLGKSFNLGGKVKLNVNEHMVFDSGYKESGKTKVLYIPHANVSGRYKVNKEKIIAKNLDVRVGNTDLSVDLGFEFVENGGWELAVDSDNIDLNEIKQIAGFKVNGQGSVSCLIKAPNYDTPHITGHANLKNMKFDGFNLFHVDTNVEFNGRYLIFSDFSSNSLKSKLKTEELKLDFDEPGGLGIETKIQANGVAVEEIFASANIDKKKYGSPKGFIEGKVAIEYKSNPEKLIVAAKLEHSGLTIFNEVFGGEKIEFTINDGDIVIDRFGLTKGNGTIFVTGAMLSNGELNLMGLATDIRLEDIVFPAVSDLGVSGQLQMFVLLDGTLDHLKGKADVRLSKIDKDGQTFGASNLEIKLDDQIITAKGTIAGRLATIEYGLIDLEKDIFKLEAFILNLDIIKTFGLSLEDQEILLGITGEMIVSGKLSGKPQLIGEAYLHTVGLSIDDFSFKNKDTVVLKFNNDKFTLKRTRLLGSDVVFDLQGRANLEKMNISVKGLADLNALGELVGAVKDSSGRLTFDAIATGKWKEPKFRGQAEVKNASFFIDGFANKIDNINGSIELNAKNIMFKNFKGTSAGGTFDLGGFILLEGSHIKDYRFQMMLSDLELELMDELRFRASTVKDGLVLQPGKTRDLPHITGNIEIFDFKYTEDIAVIELSDLSMDKLSGKQIHPSTPRIFDNAKDTFTFDIQLHGERNLQIRNNILDAYLKFDDQEEPLRLIGTNQTYGFLGRVLGTKGRIKLIGKTFEIRSASVSFTDPLSPTNPYFRITADVEVRDWKLTIIAEGTPDEPSIRFTSQPHLSDEDIKFLLLTGMTKTEHSQFGSQGVEASFAQLLSSMGGSEIPVEIRVYTEYSEKAGTDTARISVGKDITDEIWMEISSSVGQERDVTGALEYRISDKLSIRLDYDNETESNELGNIGIDFKFRLEF